MTHWIFEHMLYTTQHVRQGNVYSAGSRLSCDDGKSWIVAGTVRVSSRDSFSTRTRYVTLIEYVRRCANASRPLTVVHPDRAQPKMPHNGPGRPGLPQKG